MANEQGLFIRLRLDDNDFIRGLARAAARLGAFGRAISASLKVVAKWGAGIVAAVVAYTAAFKKFGSVIGALDDFAAKLGESTVKLSAFLHVVEQSNVAQGTFETAIQRQTRRLSEFATTGAGAAARAIQELNLDVDELMQQSPTEAFTSIAGELSKVENGADKVRLAFGLWDSGGVDLLRIVDQGAEGIADLNEEGKKMATTAADIKTFQDAMGNSAHATRNISTAWTAFMASLERNIFLMDGVSWAIAKIGDGVRYLSDQMNKFRIGVLTTQMQEITIESQEARAKIAELSAAIKHNQDLIKESEGYLDDSNVSDDVAEATEQLREQELVIQGLISAHRELSDEYQSLTSPRQEATPFSETPVRAVSVFETEDEKQARLDAMAERTQSIREMFLNEENMTRLHYATLLEELDAWQAAGLDKESEHGIIRENLIQDLTNKIEAIHQESADAQDLIDEQQFNSRISGASQAFGDLSSLMNSESRKMFEVGKVAAISQAIVDGIAAAVSSWNAGAYGGPPLSAAYAAASLAATGMQIAKLSATQYGSKAKGGSTMSGGSVSGGAQPPNQAAIIQLVGSEQSVFSRDQVTGLIGQINEAVGDGAQLAMG